MDNPYISIIIRTYNEAAHVGRCLDAVFAQDCTHGFEVVLIDSGSSDETVSIAKKYPVRLVEMLQSDFTFGRSMNLGCTHAAGSLIVSLSADATPKNTDWLQTLISPFDMPDVAAVYGKEEPYDQCDPVTARMIATVFGSASKKQTKDIFFTNSNSAFRKEVWQRASFNETLVAAEDHAWARDVIDLGHAIYYAPDAVVLHSHMFTCRTLYVRFVKELTVLYRVIHRYTGARIAFKGCINCMYGVVSDAVFIVKKKRPLREIMKSIMFELTILRAHIQVALRA